MKEEYIKSKVIEDVKIIELDFYWKMSLVFCVISLISIAGLINLVSASINDSKLTICNSINLTEPNCSNWWNTLNLTDTTITVNYIDNSTYITNKTYNYYDKNESLTITYLDTRYIKTSELPNKLVDYVKKGEINNTNTNQVINNTIVQIKQSNFTWWNVLSIITFLIMIFIGYVLYQVVKEIEYIEQ